ncbi:hypothetical protein ABPG72_007212 [Tetrahymena utriculariae]
MTLKNKIISIIKQHMKYKNEEDYKNLIQRIRKESVFSQKQKTVDSKVISQQLTYQDLQQDIFYGEYKKNEFTDKKMIYVKNIVYQNYTEWFCCLVINEESNQQKLGILKEINKSQFQKILRLLRKNLVNLNEEEIKSTASKQSFLRTKEIQIEFELIQGENELSNIFKISVQDDSKGITQNQIINLFQNVGANNPFNSFSYQLYNFVEWKQGFGCHFYIFQNIEILNNQRNQYEFKNKSFQLHLEKSNKEYFNINDQESLTDNVVKFNPKKLIRDKKISQIRQSQKFLLNIRLQNYQLFGLKTGQSFLIPNSNNFKACSRTTHIYESFEQNVKEENKDSKYGELKGKKEQLVDKFEINLNKKITLENKIIDIIKEYIKKKSEKEQKNSSKKFPPKLKNKIHLLQNTSYGEYMQDEYLEKKNISIKMTIYQNQTESFCCLVLNEETNKQKLEILKEITKSQEADFFRFFVYLGEKLQDISFNAQCVDIINANIYQCYNMIYQSESQTREDDDKIKQQQINFNQDQIKSFKKIQTNTKKKFKQKLNQYKAKMRVQIFQKSCVRVNNPFNSFSYQQHNFVKWKVRYFLIGKLGPFYNFYIQSNNLEQGFECHLQMFQDGEILNNQSISNQYSNKTFEQYMEKSNKEYYNINNLENIHEILNSVSKEKLFMINKQRTPVVENLKQFGNKIQVNNFQALSPISSLSGNQSVAISNIGFKNITNKTPIYSSIKY